MDYIICNASWEFNVLYLFVHFWITFLGLCLFNEDFLKIFTGKKKRKNTSITNATKVYKNRIISEIILKQTKNKQQKPNVKIL